MTQNVGPGRVLTGQVAKPETSGKWVRRLGRRGTTCSDGPTHQSPRPRSGLKQVKWLKGVEFVASFADVGGDNQDHEFFGYRQYI